MRILLKIFAVLILGILLSACGNIGKPFTALSTVTENQSSLSLPANAVQLNWVANAGEQTGFTIQQSTDGITYSNVQTLSEPARSAVVSVTRGQTYYFKVQGFNSIGPSPATTNVTVAVP